jgi:hypothetical protein
MHSSVNLTLPAQSKPGAQMPRTLRFTVSVVINEAKGYGDDEREAIAAQLQACIDFGRAPTELLGVGTVEVE